MGALYEIGIGVDRNLDRALRLYQEAEKRGNEDARKRLQELRELSVV
jgi:TPR repeat protein